MIFAKEDEMKRINLIAAGCVLVFLHGGLVQAKTMKSRVVQKPVKVRVNPKKSAQPIQQQAQAAPQTQPATTTSTTTTVTTTTTTAAPVAASIAAASSATNASQSRRSAKIAARKQLAPLAAKSLKSQDTLRQSSAAPAPSTATVPGTTQATAAQADPSAKPKSRFGLGVILAVSRDLRVTDHPDHSAGLYVEMDPSFKLSDKLTLVGVFTGTKSFTGEMRSKVDDGLLGLSYAAIPLDEKVFSLSPRLYGILPLSDNSREVTSLQTGAVLAGRLYIKPTNSIFSMYYQPSFTRYFHEFRESIKGKLNKASKLKHKVSADIALSEKWTINLVFENSSVWDYDNEISNDFNADQSINYSINDKIGLALGHTTSGDFWNEDRSESKYSLTDPEMSEVYFGLTLSL